MKSTPLIKRATFRFALIGVLFGLAFPVVAISLVLILDIEIGVLLLIIGSAPLVLGVVASLVGVREDRIRDANANLETLIQERTASIQSLLDVTGDGFLSFGADFLVRPEYSRPCEAIFGGPIAGRRLPDLLYIEDRPKQDFVDGLELFFSGRAKAEVIFDLLDKEVELGDRVIKLDYRAINDQTIMCSLTDVTEQQALAARVAEEARRRELILRVVSNRKYFAGFMNEAENLFQLLDAMAIHKSVNIPEETSNQLAAQLHTFKGNANFLGFSRSGTVAHDLEDQLIALPILQSDLDLSSEVFVLKRQYFEELNTIRDTLGEQWLKDLGTISVQATSIRKLEAYVRQSFPGDGKLAAALEQLRRVPLVDLFSQYPELVQDIAARRGRRVREVEVQGGEFRVLPELFEPLVSALTHVARNMVDHGIESPAERELQGKDPMGEIQISLGRTAEGVTLTFSDDGRGISMAKIEQQGRESGLIGEGEKPTRQALLSLIFKPGFSTAEAVTTVSGRGIGLPAVKSAVSRLGGKLSVETKAGRGTVFRVTIPITSLNQQSKVAQ